MIFSFEIYKFLSGSNDGCHTLLTYVFSKVMFVLAYVGKYSFRQYSMSILFVSCNLTGCDSEKTEGSGSGSIGQMVE